MTTLTELRQNIEADTRRTLGSVGDRFVQNAIRHYAGRRWWFNEMIDTSQTTVANTEEYDLPAGMRVVDTVSVEVTPNDPYPLTYRDHAYFERVRVGATIHLGLPDDYTIFDEKIRIYPIPDGAYSLRITGYGLSSTDADDNTSPWSNAAYNLICCRARALIERDHFMNPEGYAIFTAAERDALRELESENTRRMARGRIRAWGL